MLAEAPHYASAILHSRPLTETVDICRLGRVQRISWSEVDSM